MDGEVEGDGDPGDGGAAEELRVAEQGRGAVVVGVEEGERLLFEEEEGRVQELEVFGQVVELCIIPSSASTHTLHACHGY